MPVSVFYLATVFTTVIILHCAYFCKCDFFAVVFLAEEWHAVSAWRSSRISRSSLYISRHTSAV